MVSDEPNCEAPLPAREATPHGRGKPTIRTALPWLMVLAVAVVGIGFVLQFFVAEKLPELTEAALESASEKWAKTGPANYDLDIELRGARPGVVHVEVRNREVIHETRDGGTPGRWTWDAWSVPGMFDTLSQDLQIAENPEQQIQAAEGTKWRLRCEFDQQYGYPARYHRLVTGGPEVFWQVTKFQPK